MYCFLPFEGQFVSTSIIRRLIELKREEGMVVTIETWGQGETIPFKEKALSKKVVPFSWGHTSAGGTRRRSKGGQRQIRSACFGGIT